MNHLGQPPTPTYHYPNIRRYKRNFRSPTPPMLERMKSLKRDLTNVVLKLEEEQNCQVLRVEAALETVEKIVEELERAKDNENIVAADGITAIRHT